MGIHAQVLVDLTSYFELAKHYRSSTSNILVQTGVRQLHMPELATRTRSPRLKSAISKFIMETANDQRTADQRH